VSNHDNLTLGIEAAVAGGSLSIFAGDLSTRGIVVESLRGEAENSSHMIIDFVDKTIF